MLANVLSSSRFVKNSNNCRHKWRDWESLDLQKFRRFIEEFVKG